MTNDLHGSQSVPFWKVMILAICAMQIGPALSSAAGYQMHWSGAGAWIAMGAAAVIALLVATAIGYLARRNPGTGAILSYVQGVLPRWAVCIVVSTLLLGYIIGPSTMTMWAAAYLGSILVELGIETAATPIAGAFLVVLIAALAGSCAYRGIELSAKVSIALGLIAVPVAIAITVMAATQHGIDVDYSKALGEMSWTGLARNTFIALAFFVGFDGIGALASGTSDPGKNAPKLLVGTVVLVGVTDTLGVFFQTPVLLAHASELEAGLTPTYVMTHATGMESMYVVVDVILYMAQLAGLIAWLNLSALIISTAGRDGFLPRMLGDRHPRTGSPYKAVLGVGSAEHRRSGRTPIVRRTGVADRYGVRDQFARVSVVDRLLLCLRRNDGAAS